MRLNFGRMDSPVTSILVWKKVTLTASRAVTPRKGPAMVISASTPVLNSSLSIPGNISASTTAIFWKVRMNRAETCSSTTSPMTITIARLPSRVATASASLLIRTLPFFRSSRLRFGVAFSVLESPATRSSPLYIRHIRDSARSTA